MRRIRVIPVLLIRDGALVKTKAFKDPTYVGDPINAIRIFNEKEVDELVVLDIGAGRQGGRPPFALLEQLAEECFMPLSFGGGISSVEDVSQVIRLGIEKVVVRTQALVDPGFVPSVAAKFGSQSVIVAVDVKRTLLGGRRLIGKAGVESRRNVEEYCQAQEALGAGEILLTSVDREGSMMGYDLDLLRAVTDRVRVPVIANAGAGSVKHMADAVQSGKASAVAAGSMFIFHKTRDAVMINFPSQEVLSRELFSIS